MSYYEYFDFVIRELNVLITCNRKNLLLADMDKELSSATVTFDEFIEMVTPRMLNRDSREEIMKVFALFDDDNTGAISFKNLKRVATELGTYIQFFSRIRTL